MPKSSKYSGSSYKPKTHGKSKTIRVGRRQFTAPAVEIAVVTHQTSHFDPVKGSSGEVTITTFTYKQHISRFLKQVEEDIATCKNEVEKEDLLTRISRSVDQEIEDSVVFTKWEGHNPKLDTTKRSALKAKGYYREEN